MAKHQVKLAPRAALRMLNSESCKIIISKASSTFVFVTQPGLFVHEGEESVRVPREGIVVPVTDISKIETSITRFTPEVKVFMEIDWSSYSPASGTQNEEGEPDER